MTRPTPTARRQLALFASGFEALAIDDRIRALIAADAPVAYSVSGGKDSVSIAHATDKFLDGLGHAGERIVTHSDLGRIEWRATPTLVEACAAAIGKPLRTVRRRAGDLLARWDRRFELGCARYEQLLTYHLTSPWSSAAQRFCTAELKTQVILPDLLRLFPGRQIISVVGIRREESVRRRLAPISKVEGKDYQRANGGGIVTWHPGVDLREDEVFTYIARHGLPLAPAYTLGSTRYGCSCCVLSSANDLRIGARAPENRETAFHLVGVEAASSFSFQPERWLGDVVGDLLPSSLAADLARGKTLAVERRRLEASLPANLRYVKGWPQRVPTLDEAAQIAAVRASILAVHNLTTPYRTADQVRTRIADLHESERQKEAA